MQNVQFDPLWTNFHYAGPREAIHHLIMRQKLGLISFMLEEIMQELKTYMDMMMQLKQLKNLNINLKLNLLYQKEDSIVEIVKNM